MPKRKRTTAAPSEPRESSVRPFWTGTITFGLVSIPVELLAAVRARQTGLKLVDTEGHALGRQYHCTKDGKKLSNDDLVRGYETGDGKIVPITDAEFESVAPEMSGDIQLRNFVPAEQIPPLYFQKPYFLAPAGKSAKAYNLLAATMEKTGRVGIGSFVMRGHEYLVAILVDNGVLRADTLRYHDEVRTPESIGLPKVAKVAAAKANQFARDIDALMHRSLDLSELDDQDAAALRKVVKEKGADEENVVHPAHLESEDGETEGAKVIDLMAVLRKSLSKSAVVRPLADSGPPISLAERRAKRTAKKAPMKRRKKAKSKRA